MRVWKVIWALPAGVLASQEHCSIMAWTCALARGSEGYSDGPETCSST